MSITKGARVRVTQGLAAGVVGVVIDRWHDLGGKPKVRQWRVQSEDLVRDRVLREDWLEVVPVDG